MPKTEIPFEALKGQTIVEIRQMTRAEMEDEAWDTYHEQPMVIILASGTRLYPMADPEGNGPGCMVAARDVDGEPYTYYVEQEVA